MFEIHPVQSLDLPELAPYCSLKREDEHRKQELFVAEGEKVVRRLLESELEVISLLLPEKWVGVYEPLLITRKKPFLYIQHRFHRSKSSLAFPFTRGFMRLHAFRCRGGWRIS